ncbi:hypothetical protein ARR50_15450 [Listeria monocytogenes]|uniref:hypothetical protein n=1 Tax=Listeria seeligeri TaxID=1640 RepID=UPI0010B90130|nr:hypothetical protein [Listeria seeligeri]EAC4922939.1 hypothetical protein [Listeria monocytogenes]EAD0667638.1 hypothetical protein [Listeria monocytogenes]EAE0837186.1 hypothetical protein [Listeria monocytogenes]EAE0840387.1 hypothetical protein [Listeria monocytogenes]MBF2584528.1 hypothetical protein [Listeria seeligeri]
MRTETIITHVKCDICGKSNDKGFSIDRKRVAVLEIGCLNEYGHFHKDISKNIKIKQLDLCKTCADMANDRIIKSKSEMFTEKVYYSFQDVGEVSE